MQVSICTTFSSKTGASSSGRGASSASCMYHGKVDPNKFQGWDRLSSPAVEHAPCARRDTEKDSRQGRYLVEIGTNVFHHYGRLHTFNTRNIYCSAETINKHHKPVQSIRQANSPSIYSKPTSDCANQVLANDDALRGRRARC